MKIPAGSSLLTLLDDIVTLLDDISVVGKLAAKKTMGVLRGDLSLNAQQASGVRANHELPVAWSVTKGSFVSKVILVSLALLTSAFIPWVTTPLLMVGGAFLCLEGVEEVLHTLETRRHREIPEERQQRLTFLMVQNLLAFEKDKIRGAIRTDFILSAGIAAITLGAVAGVLPLNQALVLSGIVLVMIVGVYGLVGTTVRPDNIGYWLMEKCNLPAQSLGKELLVVAPWFTKTPPVVGVLAMFLVGGDIVVHEISSLHYAAKHLAQQQSTLTSLMLPALFNLALGSITGGIAVLLVKAVAKVRGISH